MESLEAAGYQRAAEDMKWFQMRRLVRLEGDGPVAVIVDLLMPREAKFQRNKPPLLANFAVQKADGAGVAMQSCASSRADPAHLPMPADHCSAIPWRSGASSTLPASSPTMRLSAPVTVRKFLSDSAALGDMTADQVQVDAFRQVRAWLDRLGL